MDVVTRVREQIAKGGYECPDKIPIAAHEIAHALREHSREKVSRAYAQQMGVSILAAVAGLGEGGAKALGMATEVAVGLPNSRTMESESDAVGVELAARGGYDPLLGRRGAGAGLRRCRGA